MTGGEMDKRIENMMKYGYSHPEMFSFNSGELKEMNFPEPDHNCGMICADLPLGGEQESKQERAYREKQEALRKSEHDRNQEQARRLREAGEVLSRDYTQSHDHKLGWTP